MNLNATNWNIGYFDVFYCLILKFFRSNIFSTLSLFELGDVYCMRMVFYLFLQLSWYKNRLHKTAILAWQSLVIEFAKQNHQRPKRIKYFYIKSSQNRDTSRTIYFNRLSVRCFTQGFANPSPSCEITRVFFNFLLQNTLSILCAVSTFHCRY